VLKKATAAAGSGLSRCAEKSGGGAFQPALTLQIDSHKKWHFKKKTPRGSSPGRVFHFVRFPGAM
jgi:hypothetical protein